MALRKILCILSVLVHFQGCTDYKIDKPNIKFTPPKTALVEHHIQVTMRDGIMLNTHIFVPDQGIGQFSTILVRTPYNGEIEFSGHFFETMIEDGYAIVLQHERGRYLSEGDYSLLVNAQTDGLDTLDWIVAQPWSNGKVGTIGCSSSAENQLKLAAANHPAHKAIIVQSSGVGIAEAGPYREQGNFWRGGVWQQGWFNYFYNYAHRNWPQLPPGLSNAERKRASRFFMLDNNGDVKEPEFFGAVRMHLPMIDMMRAIDGPATDFEEYILRGPYHPSWDDFRVTEADRIHIPGIWAEALYDISARSAVAYFQHTRKVNAGANNQRLIITNGGHCSFGREEAITKIGERPLGDPRFDYFGYYHAWFNYWLKGEGSLPKGPIVRVYMAGENAWRGFDKVPKAGVDKSIILYLNSGGKANTADGDGILSSSIPRTSSVDRFIYNPADPVISLGGEIAGMGADQAYGSFDQRRIEARQDVLVYTTKPLETDISVFGFIDAILHVASDCLDTDFTVKLVDVEPDGTSYNIADSIIRMRYREGIDHETFMTPGEVYMISLPPMLAANVFKAGHRIRLEVSSSNFPNYARSLNTEANPYTSSEYKIAHNEVHHGPLTSSSIVLPVVE